MTKIEIYTKEYCGFCSMAKRLLSSKGLTWDEIDVSGDPDKAQEMARRAGGRMSVPEIFIDGKLVGGYQELLALEQAGELDAMLASG